MGRAEIVALQIVNLEIHHGPPVAFVLLQGIGQYEKAIASKGAVFALDHAPRQQQVADVQSVV